jgi:filamentous hemagglutinin family protein
MKRNSGGVAWQIPLLGSLTVSGILGLNLDRAIAQITPDDTLENEESVVNAIDSDRDRIDGGAIRGSNLLHSFSEFNVGEGRGVYFSNPEGIANILTRVTGGNPSNILGKLGVDGAANLFLLNPNGILFGENASLDVQGSFVATTANAIQFGEQGSFSASAPELPQLLTINPSAFLFNQLPAGSIVNNSTASAGKHPADFDLSGLRVPDGQSLILLGGNVSLDGGNVNAIGGRIELGGLTKAGKVGVNLDENNLSLNFPKDIERADVSLNNDAIALVAGENNGDIAVNARNINILNGSEISAGIEEELGTNDSQAGNITLNATNDINVVNDGFLKNLVNYGANGKAGNLNIQTTSLVLENQGGIAVENRGFGDTGDLIVKTETLQSKDSSIWVILRGKGGNAGDLRVNASNRIELSGESLNDDGSILSPGGILNQVDIEGKGQGGNITIETPNLSISNGSKVQVATFGIGNPGKLLIRASEVEVFDTPDSQNQFNTGIFAGILQDPRNTELPQGKETSLTIETERLSIRGGAEVSTQTQGKANAGDIFIQARDSLEVVGSKNGDPSFLGSEVNSPGSFTVYTKEEITGRGGNVNIKTGQLSVRDGGRITASTFATGDAGNVKIEASDSVILSEDGSGIFAEAAPDVQGRGGDLTIQTGNFFINKNAQISAKTEFGEGGNIFLQVNNNLILRNNSTISSQAGKNANGGNIDITADSILAFDDSDIFAFARDGKGGNITLDTPAYFGNSFTLNSLQANPDSLNNNDRADINATGAVSGIVDLPDVSFIQNSLADLPDNAIDTENLIANSCVVRSRKQEGKFIITGTGGLPENPADASVSSYPTGDVRGIDGRSDRSQQPSDAIVEPQGVYRTSNGQLILSRECD